MMKRGLAAFLLAVALWGLAACRPADVSPPPAPATQTPIIIIVTPTPTEEPLAAMVNGEPITMAEYQRELARYEASLPQSNLDPSTPEGEEALAQARAWVLDRMIEQRLILQAAAEEGITVSDEEVEASITSLKNDLGEEAFRQRLADQGMSEDELREALRREMIASRMMEKVVASVPTHGPEVHARHILVATEAEAQQILQQLQAGADFATLAQQYSIDESTRDRGGDLGTFPRGTLTLPEVEEAAFSLQAGQISGVIHSAWGYHIVQVLDRIEDTDYDPVSLRILRDKAIDTWLQSLWDQADIRKFVSTGA